jgi:hypothetical protein
VRAVDTDNTDDACNADGTDYSDCTNATGYFDDTGEGDGQR